MPCIHTDPCTHTCHTAVVIGFSNDNSSVIITEGDPAQTICLEVKAEGLRLDPFDTVPLNIRIEEIPGMCLSITNDLINYYK